MCVVLAPSFALPLVPFGNPLRFQASASGFGGWAEVLPRMRHASEALAYFRLDIRSYPRRSMKEGAVKQT